MSAALIAARLAADATLLATLTGGVHDHATLGVLGASKLPASAYTAGGKLKPLAIVRGRAVVPTGELADRSSQYASTRQVVEVWLYDDRDATAAALDTAGARIYALLQERPVTGTYALVNASWDRGGRAIEYGEARMSRMEWVVRGRLP